MANFTQNITNAVRCFGNGPSTKWGDANGTGYTMTWGASTWGEGLPVRTTKIFVIIVSNSLSSTFDYYRSEVRKLISNSLDLTSDNSTETLTDGSGDWTYVFVSNRTNAELRDQASWSAGSTSSVSFACQAASSVSWA